MPDNEFNSKVEQRLHELTGASTTEIRDMALGLQVENSINRIIATAPSSAEKITPEPPSITTDTTTLRGAPLVGRADSAATAPSQGNQLTPVIETGCLNGTPAVGIGAYYSAPAEITT